MVPSSKIQVPSVDDLKPERCAKREQRKLAFYAEPKQRQRS